VAVAAAYDAPHRATDHLNAGRGKPLVAYTDSAAKLLIQITPKRMTGKQDFHSLITPTSKRNAAIHSVVAWFLAQAEKRA